MTPRPGSSNWACDVRLFAKIHPALCDDAINQSKQLQPASHAMRVGKETMILNMLPAESEVLSQLLKKVKVVILKALLRKILARFWAVLSRTWMSCLQILRPGQDQPGWWGQCGQSKRKFRRRWHNFSRVRGQVWERKAYRRLEHKHEVQGR